MVGIAGLLLALVTARLVAQTAPPDQRLEKLTVDYGFQFCDKLPEHGTIQAKVTGLTLGNVYYNDVPFSLPVVTAPAAFSVIPDDYHVEGSVGANCTLAAAETVIVLPGHPTTTRMDLGPCCGDATPGPNVAGFVEPGMHVEIVDEAEDVVCSGRADRAALKTWPVTRDGSAYYGGGVLLAFGDAHSEALVRIPESTDKEGIMWGGYFRFDVTQAALRENSSPGGTIIRCLSAPMPSPSTH
jgi:hypothetical protein